MGAEGIINSILNPFDKIDDIVYEPVRAISRWIEEPLKSFDHKRKMAEQRQTADIEMEKMQLEAEIREHDRRSTAELQCEMKKRDAEIQQMIDDHKAANLDRLVESIKRYQIELGTASQEIIKNIGLMNIELRERANTMVLEKTKQYVAIQDEAKSKSNEELRQAKADFGDDPVIYGDLVKQILEERRIMINNASQFIIALSDDLKRLNETTDDLARNSNKTLEKVLDRAAPISVPIDDTTAVLLEKK